MRRWTILWLTAALALETACSGDDSTSARATNDAGTSSSIDAGTSSTPDGFTLKNAPPVDPNDLQNATLLLTASGESLALNGYNFPAMSSGDAVFADGWQVSFTHFIATFDKVTLSQNPDTAPTDQSQTGSLVAELDGPWVVDLHANSLDFPYIDGKEQGERAVAFAVLSNQNMNGNQPFPTDGTRFAVGFSAVVATESALDVNLDADGLAQYEAMVHDGCTVLYVGQAVWKGDQGTCVTPASGGDAGASAGGAGQEPEFALLPRTVNFNLCFKPADSGGLVAGNPETSWINCDNMDNDPATPLNGEPHERGIAFVQNTYTIGEVTFHTDHPFWESTQHDTPARFDQFAAQVVGDAADGGDASDGGPPTVSFSDVVGVDYTGFKDKLGNVLPWRTCDPNYQNPNGGSRVGQMNFDPVSVPHCQSGDHGTGLCDYADFSKYDQSTQGHWNGADGLCFVRRHYPSPP